MAETKNVEKIKLAISKQKGVYTGEAISGILGAIPEGYGKLVLNDGRVLEGRFKEGNFVSGKAVSASGTIFEGEFDNLIWLNGKVTYPNGDFVEGGLNSKTKTMEFSNFKFTQQYGDILQGSHINVDGQTVLKATQAFADGSIIEGVFLEVMPRQNGFEFEKENIKTQDFGFIKPALVCFDAEMDLKICSDEKNKTKVNFVGRYKDGKYTGKLSILKNGFASTLDGVFDFLRESIDETMDSQNVSKTKKHSLSDDFCGVFGGISVVTPYVYNINMLGGKVLLRQNENTFQAEKKLSSQNETIYVGKLVLGKVKQTIIGEFYQDFVVKSGKLEFLAQPVNSSLVGDFRSGKFVGENKFFNGDYQIGQFSADLSYEKSDEGMPEHCTIKTRFLSGELRKTLKNPNYDSLVFVGKTLHKILSKEQDGYELFSNPKLKQTKAKIAYYGKLIGTLADEEILSKKGLFDGSFGILEGNVIETMPIDGQNLHVKGNRKFNENGEPIFVGRVAYDKTANFFEGTFTGDDNYKFLFGKLEVHLEDGSCFVGSTKDGKNYVGQLEQEDMWIEDGSFVSQDLSSFEFIKGKTAKDYQRSDGVCCFALFNRNGYDEFGNKKMIATVVSDDNRQVIDMFACDSFEEALKEYDRKIEAERILDNIKDAQKQAKDFVLSEEKESYSKQEVQALLESVLAEKPEKDDTSSFQ